jgi:hypothetical protein
MNDEMRNIKRIALLSLLIAGAFAPAVKGQILSRGNLFGPGAPPPMVGIEIGLGQHTEQGNLACDCGANFSGGTGTGLLGNLLFELPLDYDWAIGVKAGIDFKNFSTTGIVNDVVIVEPANTSQYDTVSMNISRVGTIKATYLSFAPYVQYQFFRMGPFVQAGVDFGILIANNLTQDRQLIQNYVTPAGQPTIYNLTFTNGTNEEVIQNGTQTAVNTLRIGLLLSAGYNIAVSERSVFAPLLTYDFPVTSTGNTTLSNWKIGSLYFSGELKFRLD